MCKFYAHHLTCPLEKKNQACDFLHDHQVRATHDIVRVNSDRTIPKEELREHLIYKYDPFNSEHRKEVYWKEEALNRYPDKPTFREKKRGNYIDHREKLLKFFEDGEKSKQTKKTKKMDQETDEVVL